MFNIKTVYDLKYYYNKKEIGFFFDRKTMKFFGDTMSNYRLDIKSHDEVYILNRRKAVKGGSKRQSFFCKKTLEVVFFEDVN